MTVYKLTSEYDKTITFSIDERKYTSDDLLNVISYIQFRAHDFNEDSDVSNEEILYLLVKWLNIEKLNNNRFGFEINVDDLWESNCGHYDEVINNVPVWDKARELLDLQISNLV